MNKQYDIQLTAVILKFDPDKPNSLFIGVTEDEDNIIHLPSIRWTPEYDFEPLVRNLLTQHLKVSREWLSVELLTVIRGDDTVNIVYRTYIPNNIVSNNIEWISYDRLELIGQRFVRHDLKALRTAINRV